MPPTGLLGALLQREVGGPPRCVRADPQPCCGEAEVARSLASWVEADSLRHLAASYCSFRTNPRSTIAAAFSPDGLLVASTQCVPLPLHTAAASAFAPTLVAELLVSAAPRSGDHTVKLCCCRTGICLRALTGHRRTPWVVRPQDVNAVLGAKSGAQSLTRRPLLLQVSFHPRKAHILASGSLDFEVRVWDAISAACLVATNFGAQRWKAVPCARPAR